MFKKSLLLATAAAAAAASFAAPVSAADVRAAAYADLRYGLDYFTDKPSGNPPDINFENHGSYWGFKGSAEQNGITAFGGYERWLDADSTNAGYDFQRQAYAGVKSGWGTVEYGTFATAYMESGRKLDPFYATGAAGVGRPSFTYAGGASHGLSALTGDGNVFTSPSGGAGFVANQLAYTSPGIFGVTLNGAVMFDDSTGTNSADDFAGGVEFNQWGITAGLQYLDANSAASNTGLAQGNEAYRLYGGYAQKRFGAGVSAERIDRNASAIDQSYLMVSGWFGIMEGTRVAASYGMENETGAEGNSLRVGLFYDVLDNFTTSVVYRNFNSTQFAITGQPDDQVISLGATYKFELSGSGSMH